MTVTDADAPIWLICDACFVDTSSVEQYCRICALRAETANVRYRTFADACFVIAVSSSVT
eukprot:XP_001706137.1 Hypothetical protein GL50803_7861 [Giardia lamblia ATCC 50803]